jgi:hypothetical protein|tara:strand:+ start:1161 stop:2129 length:969 start_codon:yes stop_codon:yes gene_type:complete
MPQSYILGGKIRAADFNLFANDINDIVGIGANDSGYGQGHLVVTNAVVGGSVTASLWDELLISMKYASRHQGTTITVPTSTSDAGWPAFGDIISIIPALVNDIANIVGNKLNSDVAYMTATANVLSDSSTFYDPNGSPGTPTWTNINQVFYEAKVLFTDADARRHFFNSGGEVRVDAALVPTDGSHAQSVDWQTMLSAIATVKLGHTTTESSASVGTPGIGFNNLTTTYQLVYTKGGTGDYSGNQLNIYAKLNGAADIDVKISFDDAHPADTGSWSNDGGGTWTGTDYVAGALSVTLDEFRPTDSPDGVFLPSPTYSTISSL